VTSLLINNRRNGDLESARVMIDRLRSNPADVIESEENMDQCKCIDIYRNIYTVYMYF
jgi:hypothetical protein